jgi:hypothetical protein
LKDPGIVLSSGRDYKRAHTVPERILPVNHPSLAPKHASATNTRLKTLLYDSFLGIYEAILNFRMIAKMMDLI